MPKTKSRVLIIALVSVTVALALVWISTHVTAPWNTVLATLATVILTIGLVNLVSDVLLRKSVSDDLISLIQSDRRLIEAGLDGLARIDDVDWVEFLSSDDKVECLVLDHSTFKSVIWPRIMDAAKIHLTQAEIVLINPDAAAAVGEVAHRLDLNEATYSSALAVLRADLEREWKALKSQASISCSLTVRLSDQAPAHAYIETPHRAAILLEPLSRSTGHAESHALLFRTQRRLQTYAAWLTSSVAALRETYSAPVYTDDRADYRSLNGA